MTDDLHKRSLPPVTIHVDTPSVARVHDYYLGGSANWVVDRQFGDLVLEQFPLVRRLARVQRVFLSRVVRYMLRQGVRQFLDVGAGVPSRGSTHEVAEQLVRGRAFGAHAHPTGARVVYVDNDPIAVAQTELLLDRFGDPRRQIAVEADLRDPADLWQRAINTEVIDPGQPVALLLIAVLHLQQLDADGNEISVESVLKLSELLPTGSYAAISHITDDGVPVQVKATLAGLQRLYGRAGASNVVWRSRDRIASMLENLRIVEPGWTSATDWRPDQCGDREPAAAFPSGSDTVVWVGVGKKA